MAQEFDQQLPEDCPPSSATSRSQAAYRIVKTDPATVSDFRTHTQLGLAPNVDLCRRSTLSIFATYRQANHRRSLTPTLGAHVAHAVLTESHGVISSPNSAGHMDWWAFADMVKPSEFKVVADEH